MIIKKDILIENCETKFLYSGEHHQFDYLSGKKTVQKESIDNFHLNIAKRKEFCANKNILFMHVVFPCKAVVLAERIKSINVKPIFNDKFINDDVIYPVEVLKKNIGTFLKTDTHTTPFGSWLILQNIIDRLNLKFEDEPSFDKSYILGDLNRMLGIDVKEEYLEFTSFINNPTAIYDVNNYQGLKGNSNRVRILKNVNPIIDKRVLIFGDSFFNYNLNYMLANIFKEVVFFRSPNFLYEIIDYIEPDIILSGQAERYLPAGLSDENYTFPFLNHVTQDYKKHLVPEVFNSALDAIMAKNNSDKYSDWHNNISANLLRDLAISFESTDLKKALLYMNKALAHRPKGPLILKKIEKYNELLVESGKVS